jgi:glycosyltransferase involved in cell wall biosynthesis
VPITIAYVAPWVTVGGSDKNTVDWFRRIDRERFRPILVTTQPSDNELLPLVESYAAEIHVLPDMMPGRDMPTFLARLITARDVRVVHVMNSRLGFDLLPALRGAYPQLATVVQLHSEEPDRSGYVRYVATRYDDVIDAYSAASRDLRDRFIGYGVDPAKVDVIYCGVDAEGEYTPGPTPDPCPYVARERPGLEVLFAARLDWEKDPLLMVSVAAGLADAGSNARIHVVGDGPMRADVARAVDVAGLDDRVILHGAVEAGAMRAWYRSTHAVLLTSTFEAVPLVVCEAMACGRPVVVPAVGAIGELVDDATNGYVVDDRSDVAAYVDAILRLERDPILREQLGAAGRRHVLADFPLDRMAPGHEHLYDRVLAARAHESPGPFDEATWQRWAPRDTVPLWCNRVAPPGASLLATGHTPPRGGAWSMVARVWTRPFPGTEALVETHHDGESRYVLAPDGHTGPLGYVTRQPLPGMVPLVHALASVAPAHEHLRAIPGWAEPPTPLPDSSPSTWASLPPR